MVVTCLMAQMRCVDQQGEAAGAFRLPWGRWRRDVS